MDLNKKEKLLILLVILVFAFVGWTNKKDDLPMEFVSSNEQLSSPSKDDAVESEMAKKVHISGEIQYPGVYEFEEGDRLDDLIKSAGGLLNTADEGSINLAQILQDEMKIHIPHIDEDREIKPDSDPLVNIKTADLNELKTLPGIGDKKAEAILQFREDHGFEAMEDLMLIPGIGEGIYNNLKDQITIK